MVTNGKHPQEWLPPGKLDHLKTSNTGICWWCRERPATTGEHKYKQSDLARLMGDDTLVWFGDQGFRDIRGTSGIKRDRHGVIKFPKSLCAPCNNQHSQPFDRAYSIFSDHLASTQARKLRGISFESLYGEQWRDELLNLARYYAKHFGCRMVHSGIEPPDSLCTFMDGDENIPDVHMALATTDSVERIAGKGLTLSADFVWTNPAYTEIRGCVMATYVGSIGVRFQWWAEEHKPDDNLSQFFHFPNPVLNRFEDEQALMEGRVKRPGWSTRFLQWLAEPPGRTYQHDEVGANDFNRR